MLGTFYILFRLTFTWTLSAWVWCFSYKKDFFLCRKLELSFVPGAAQRESISFWFPGLRSSSSQETLCSQCCHTSTQFPSRTQRHNPHQTEQTLKYSKRYLWYSLSLAPYLLGSARRIMYFLMLWIESLHCCAWLLLAITGSHTL